MRYFVKNPSTLLEALLVFYPDSSKRTLLNWIEKKRVFVNNKVVSKKNFTVKSGDLLSIGPKEKVLKSEIKILFEDRFFVIIEKPEGMLSVPLDEGPSENAWYILKKIKSLSSILPVHRLDRETSGVMMFAKGKVAQEAFKELFFHHDIKREYMAIVEGQIFPDKDTWQSYLMEMKNLHVKATTAEEGSLAITHYEVVERNEKYSLLRLNLETGKKHQIRVHCKEARHPVLGDKKYGATEDPLHRVALHAIKLEFVDPFSKKLYSFTSPLPKIFLTKMNFTYSE
jgi:tRNA pseudouridine32 synthase/23S rRNA pseudouridine746 synthase/23S rRNA pseudouridine1911/1915/1917 synthase